MTAYRFRVKFAPDPTSLWRDIVVGADRTIAEFQSAINPAVGLDQTHLWFMGTDEEYWDSEVKYQCPQEYEQSSGGDPVFRTERLENAGEVTIGEMARQLDLEQYDRICYLYDYGDEWRFYAILKEVLDDEPSDTEPAVVNTEGESIDQYGSSRERRLSGYTTRNLGNAPNLLTTEQEYPFGEQSEAGSARRFGRNHVSRPRNPL